LEMATGRRPWANLDNEWAIMYHIAAGHLPQLPSSEQLSDQGQTFLMRCLQRDPMVRATAVELLEDPWIVYIRNIVLGQSALNDDGDPTKTPPESLSGAASFVLASAAASAGTSPGSITSSPISGASTTATLSAAMVTPGIVVPNTTNTSAVGPVSGSGPSLESAATTPPITLNTVIDSDLEKSITSP